MPPHTMTLSTEERGFLLGGVGVWDVDMGGRSDMTGVSQQKSEGTDDANARRKPNRNDGPVARSPS
jgi:hypothetical protein